MGQFYRVFADTAADNQPSGTTLKRNGAAGDYTRQDDGADEVLRYLATSGGTTARGLAYDDAVCSGQTEALILLRDQSSSNPSNARTLLFASDGPDNEYGAFFYSAASPLVIYRRVNGSFANLGQATPVSFSAATYFYLRLQVTPGSPNQIKAKAWPEGDTEPTAWSIETTDSNLSLTTGWAGHVGFTQDENVYYKVASFGWDGDPAPTGPVGGTIPTLSAPGVIDIGSTSVRPQVTLTY